MNQKKPTKKGKDIGPEIPGGIHTRNGHGQKNDSG